MDSTSLEQIEKLNEWIKHSNNIVFFGGAGVSTESGIPDFRSKDGLYNQKYKFQPEIILSHQFFLQHTEDFFDFYKDKMNSLSFEPNVTHNFLAALEHSGKLKAVITQNIDGLHQKAGSKNVLELHGSIHRNYCMRCQKEYTAEYVFNSKEKVPHCACGGIIKPDVVLYGESLDESVLNRSIQLINDSDMLIVGGTSLTVYPAASLLCYYKKDKLVLINKNHTDLDRAANLLINDKLGNVFSRLSI